MKMDEKESAEKLNSLIQLDIDAVHAYDQAIENIDVTAIRNQLTEYRDDHNDHIKQLSMEVRALGKEPPEYSPDFKGYLIKGFTSLRSMTGTEGSLKAMQTNEHLTNKNYSEAVNWQLPESARQIVEKNYSDERIHLEYIENILKSRIWEK